MLKWAQWQRQQKDRYKTEGGIASEWTQHMGGVDAAKAAYHQYKIDEANREAETLKEKTFQRKRLHKGKQLVYPIDSTGDQFYPECIKFTVYKRQGSSLETVTKKLEAPISQIAAGFDSKSAKAKILDEIKAKEAELKKLKNDPDKERQRKLNERIEYLNEIKNGDQNILGIITNEKNVNAIVDATKSVFSGLKQKNFLELKEEQTDMMQTIFLNMPNEIVFAEENSWEGAELGTLVGGMAKGKPDVKGAAFSQFSNMLGGGLGSALGNMIKEGAGGALTGGVIGMLGGAGAQKALESGTGKVANPYKEMTFSGIGFREFSFNFVFRARNEAEVNVVQDIIQTFRYYSKPLYSKGESGFFSYPEEFHIEFLIKQKADIYSDVLDSRFVPNPYIPQIKMCVLKTINTNFAAQNAWRSLQNGAPVEISLALTFVETELVTGEDVIGATNVGRFAGTKKEF